MENSTQKLNDLLKSLNIKDWYVDEPHPNSPTFALMKGFGVLKQTETYEEMVDFITNNISKINKTK
jgi:hypothetical protein